MENPAEPQRENPYPPSLPPPVYGQYPPWIPNAQYQQQQQQQYQHYQQQQQPPNLQQQPQYYQQSNANFPQTYAAYNSNVSQVPYSNSHTFQRRRQVFDSQSNGVISKIAEEKTRSAFNSILIVLDTFSSMSDVLENTFQAIHGSFRTLTNVADHIIFLRNHFAELALIPSAVQIIAKFFRWLLQALGLRRSTPFQNLENQLRASMENSGDDSFPNPDSIVDPTNSGSTCWPIVAFLCLVFGTPYMVRKLIGAPAEVVPKSNRPAWIMPNGKHYKAKALHDFVARNPNELSFKMDDLLFVKPESMLPGTKWVIGTLAQETNGQFKNGVVASKQIGLVPVDYVRILTE